MKLQEEPKVAEGHDSVLYNPQLKLEQELVETEPVFHHMHYWPMDKVVYVLNLALGWILLLPFQLIW